MDRGNVDDLIEAVTNCTGPRGHVIWDWNGTLLDDVEHAIATMNGLLESHALPRLDRVRYHELFEFPVRCYYDALGFDYAKESFEALCDRFVDRFMEGLAQLPLVPQMKSALETFQRLGLRQSILSAADQRNLDSMIGHFGLQDVFARVVGTADRFAASKIERGRELLAESEISPQNTILIGDTLHDREVAHELGIHVLLVDHGHHPRAKLLGATVTTGTARVHVWSGVNRT
jgi:phosphoglycolate phosphatase